MRRTLHTGKTAKKGIMLKKIRGYKEEISENNSGGTFTVMNDMRNYIYSENGLIFHVVVQLFHTYI